jgi:hypothetical protein
MSESDDLTAAMTELAKLELALTNENTRDGKRIYIVDSVSLTEDELILREACAHSEWHSSLFSESCSIRLRIAFKPRAFTYKGDKT